MRIATLLITLASLVGFAGCAKEVGRVPFTTEGAGKSQVTLAAGEVDFWTDIDIEYQGDAALAYQVELLQGGTKVATANCNPLGEINVKMSWVETNFNDKHSRSGNGKMKCSVTVAKGGPTEVNASVAFSQKPEALQVKKLDLVIKQ